MNRIGRTLALGLALAVAAAIAPRVARSQTQPAKARIGVYESRCVALAWGRSAGHIAIVEAIAAEGKAAKEANDTAKLAELDGKMKAMQDLAHVQVFGNAPIPDVLARVEGEVAALGAELGLQAIAADVAWSGAGVEIVDVTDQVAGLFKPDEETRKLMQGLRNAKRAPMKIVGD